MTTSSLLRMRWGSRRMVAAVLTGMAAVAAIPVLHDSHSVPRTFEQRQMTRGQLTAFSHRLHSPVYWAPTSGRVTVTHTKAGITVVTGGGLTVATYPVAGAAQNLRRQAARDSRRVLAASNDDRVLLLNRDRASDVYLAAPGENWQVEVQGIKAARTLDLATGGGVVPVA